MWNRIEILASVFKPAYKLNLIQFVFFFFCFFEVFEFLLFFGVEKLVIDLCLLPTFPIEETTSNGLKEEPRNSGICRTAHSCMNELMNKVANCL